MSVNLENMKFHESDFAGKDISSLPDRPSESGMSAQELKARFDLVPKILIAMGKFNELIDALHKSGAEAIGIKDLLEKIKDDIIALEQVESARAAQELARVEAEIARVQAELQRVEAENERKGAESSRAEAESLRAHEEEERYFRESARASAENQRQQAEFVRSDAETARTEAENVRKSNEALRKNNENVRVSSENERIEAESARASAEQSRNASMAAMTQIVRSVQSELQAYASKEKERAQAETARQGAETARSQAEEQRIAAETARRSDEDLRNWGELARLNNETARVSAEEVRIAQESVREENRRNFHFLGDWQSGVYKQNNMVRHLGKVYLAVTDTQNEPPHSDWLLISSEGKSLDIAGTFPSVEELKAAYPQGHSKMFTAENKVYMWSGEWVAIGSIGGGLNSDEVLSIVQPKLNEKVGLEDSDYKKLLTMWEDYNAAITFRDEFIYQETRGHGLEGLSEIVENNCYSLQEKIDKRDIVNDFTTGGANKVLSAEQGKVLFQSVVDGKKRIATAINDKRFEAVANQDLSFVELAEKIKGIETYYKDSLFETLRDAVDFVYEKHAESGSSLEEGVPAVFTHPIQPSGENAAVAALNLEPGLYFVEHPEGRGITELQIKGANVCMLNEGIFRSPHSASPYILRGMFFVNPQSFPSPITFCPIGPNGGEAKLRRLYYR